ncbi:cell wall metabolism sensor histidine kinase WalK [Arthrobacter sp. B3I4]|uniref:sensor histidine kinase n=1 Tax=Arthrobacter sp. B3I4 TaxID=3042267 RepID=UPI00278987F2|nr:PAS domain-containing sensor histidine kinase [Arthrobacter sp. B3I4]MDQ0755511.1 signal transduction histidine kinase [Arthrobacter sp. B3I4]
MGEWRLVRGVRVDRHGGPLHPRLLVLASQLPLTLLLTAGLAAAPAAWELHLSSGWGQTAVALHAAIFLGCLLVPWQRFSPLAALIVPVLDLAAIGMSRAAAADELPGLGVLSVLPVVWVAASRLSPGASACLSFFGPLLAGFPWFFGAAASGTSGRFATILLLALTTLSVALAIEFVKAQLLRQQRKVESKEAQLQSHLGESRERERLLNAILDAVDVGIIAVGADGRRLLTNSWQARLESSAAPPGASRPAEPEWEDQLVLTGRDQATPLPPNRRPLRRALAGESFADHLVCFGAAPAGRAVSTGARPLRNDDGSFGGAVVVYNEVTGLVNALAAKEDVVATVSHEFRTPLTSIIGNLDLVLGEELTPPVLRRIEVAQRNAERLLALVSDLLMSASSAVHVHPRKTDLAGLVEASLGSAQAHAQAAQVSLAMDVPSPLWANVDPLRIRQALDNLVSNAIKYSPDGGAVTVSARTEDDRVLLCVEDSGIGMTAADAEKVFTRFFRSPAVRDGAIPGAGLGLSITKAIVEGHGGSITCRTQPGCGSTFTLDLPADEPPPAF